MILFVANLYCEIYCNGERGVLHIVDATTANKIKDELTGPIYKGSCNILKSNSTMIIMIKIIMTNPDDR